MVFELTKEQEMIKKNAADFAKKVLAPIAYDDERNKKYPADAIKQMEKLEFPGMRIPTQYGGAGMDFCSLVLMIQEIAKVNASVAAIATTHIVQVAETIVTYATEKQKERYLPSLAKGEKLGGYAYVEEDAGITSGKTKVTGKKSGEKYVLSGKKTFVSNGGVADVYLVVAQTSEEAGVRGLSAFLVDASQVKIGKEVDKLGLRSFPTAELIFDEAEATLLGEENQGNAIMADIQAKTDIVYGAIATGVGQAAEEASIEHCKTRVQFGAPIGKIQAVQFLLADLVACVKTMELATLNGAATLDQGGDHITEGAYIKMTVSKAGFEVGMNAVQIHGGIGYSREANIERYFRDIRGTFNVENASEFPQRIIIKQKLK